MACQRFNPNDGVLLKSFERMTNAQLEQALAAAEICLQTWKRERYAGHRRVPAHAHHRQIPVDPCLADSRRQTFV
jgi:succinate-semialdehyde dehydrogenase/glutarate-semialdehyde dehydrogenase